MLCIAYCQSPVECCWRCCSLNLYHWPVCVTFHSSYIRDLGIYHNSRLKYDEHISHVVHRAFVGLRSILILKCLHSRDHGVSKLAFCTCVRLLLEFFPRFGHLTIDTWLTYWVGTEVFHQEVVRSSKSHISPESQSLWPRITWTTQTHFDLVLCYEIIHAHCNTTLEFTRGCTVTRRNMYKMSKQTVLFTKDFK